MKPCHQKALASGEAGTEQTSKSYSSAYLNLPVGSKFMARNSALICTRIGAPPTPSCSSFAEKVAHVTMVSRHKNAGAHATCQMSAKIPESKGHRELERHLEQEVCAAATETLSSVFSVLVPLAPPEKCGQKCDQTEAESCRPVRARTSLAPGDPPVAAHRHAKDTLAGLRGWSSGKGTSFKGPTYRLSPTCVWVTLKTGYIYKWTYVRTGIYQGFSKSAPQTKPQDNPDPADDAPYVSIWLT